MSIDREIRHFFYGCIAILAVPVIAGAAVLIVQLCKQ